MKKLFCDKCGKLIDVTKATITCPVRHYNEYGYDMCELCYCDFIDARQKFIDEFFQPVKYQKIT